MSKASSSLQQLSSFMRRGVAPASTSSTTTAPRCCYSFFSSIPLKTREVREEEEGTGWTGIKKRLDDTRFHQFDDRPPPQPICETCRRRFCACETTKKQKPTKPGPEECCQSTPQCKYCVWTMYEELLIEYETNNELYLDKMK